MPRACSAVMIEQDMGSTVLAWVAIAAGVADSDSGPLTSDRPLLDRLLASPLVDRLNVGPIATNHISWDQPHEGNLFEHLYARRSFQAAEPLPGKAGAAVA